VDVEQGVYQIDLAIQGLADAERIKLPLLSLEERRGLLDGAHLVLWPDVHYKEWRQYFVRFGFEADRASLYQGSRKVRAYARVRESARESAKEEEEPWIPFKELPSGAQVASLMSRPDWLALEFVNTALGEVEGGGLWDVKASQEEYPDKSLDIAVDFGTSNTYMMYKRSGQGEAESLSLEDCSYYFIEGSRVPRVLTAPEPWVPAKAFPPGEATLPSEIVVTEKEILEKQPSEWRPIEDYGILGAEVEAKYPDVEYTVAGFKWQETVTPPSLRSHYGALRINYLKLLLLIALANLAKRGELGRNLNVMFSYPLSFNENMKETFENNLREVKKYLEKATGLKVPCQLGIDETRAASESVGSLKPDYNAYLFVDIGGGSTDISLIVVLESSKAKFREVVANIDSIRYAGGDLVTALSDGGCLQGNITPDHFRRRIRETGSLASLWDEGLRKSHRGMITTKTGYFYGYLMEYLARILAAHFVNNEWKEFQYWDKYEREWKKYEYGLDELPQEYRIALFPLGNGWGFGELRDRDYVGIFAHELQERVRVILSEINKKQHPEIKKQPPEVRIKVQLPPRHPKEVVALGLLQGGNQGSEQGPTGKRLRPGGDFRTILGWTVQVGRERKLDWNLITMGGDKVPPGQSEITQNLALDCPEDAIPSFPEDLAGPYDIDRELNQARQVFQRVCLAGNRWFQRTPMQIMMEELFRGFLRKVV
jgi:hypothetical protein